MSNTQPNLRRRIVLCMDGTWDDRDSKSNIYRWYTHVDDASYHTFDNEQWIQLPAYFNGAGLSASGARDPLGAAIGEGVDQQILNAYEFIGNNVRDYEKDQVWVVGFSRGAYAARSLVGMLHNVGMVPSDQMTVENVNAAYELYRDRSPDTSPNSDKAVKFRERLGCKNPSIRFLGCFDTVGSLGIPKLPFYLGGSFAESLFHRRYRFHDTRISPFVQSAFHALAIHEQRQWFQPELMNLASDNGSQELVQVWFPGVHQDVGGGVDDDDTSSNVLPNKSLLWMMTKAQERGLVFKKPIEEICSGGSFVFHDSYHSNIIYRLLARKDRVIDPNVFGQQGARAVYESGNFSYITKDELASYPSQTLVNYFNYLKNHNT